MPYLFAIIGILIAANFYFLFKRGKKGQNTRKNAAANRAATVKRHEDLIRKLDREQIEAIKRVELRNKTLEMYEQVRREAEEAEREAEETEEAEAAMDDETDNEIE